MKRMNLIKRLGVAAVAIALCLASTVGTTFAYYTDATQAQGSLPYKWGTPTTEITEDPDGTNKIVSVKNTGDAPVLVRVKVIYAQSNATVTIGDKTEDGWVFDEKSEWFYYTQPLWNKDDSTSKLEFAVNPIEGDKSIEEFNVTILQQCAELSWHEDENSYAGTFVKGKDPVVLSTITGVVKKGMAVPGSGTMNSTLDNGMEG